MGKMNRKSVRFKRVRSSISMKVSLVLFVAIVIVFSVLGTTSYFFTKSILIENVEDNITTKSNAIADQVNSVFSEKGTIVRQIATNQEIIKYLNSTKSRNDATTNSYYEGIASSLNQIVETDESIAMAWVASNKSNFLVGSNDVLSDSSFDIKSRPWYDSVIAEDDVYFTEPYMDEVFGKMILSAMKPIKVGGETVGIVAIDIFLDQLPQIMQSYKMGENGYTFLLSKDGTILYHPNSEIILEQKLQALSGEIGTIGSNMVAGETGLELANVEGNLQYIGYSPVPTTSWSVGTALPEEEALNSLSSFTKIMVVLFSLSTIIMIVLVFFLLRYMLKEIPRVTGVMAELAQGNLSEVSLQTKSIDEMGKLLTSTNQLNTKLRDIVSQISEVSETVSSHSEELSQSTNEVKTGSEQVAVTMQELSAGTETQAHSVSNLANVMSTFATKVQVANDHGETIRDNSKEVQHMTDEGSQLMVKSTEQMEKIDQIVQDAVEKMQGLDNKTQQISNLVTVIKDVADQTNLLALNAAIEAARAGEHGKGFAVVADEVRKLAEQVSNSVSGITDIVETIQTETSHVSESLHVGYQEVQQGTAQIEATNQTFGHINEAIVDMVYSITTISENLSEIAANTQEMTGSIEEIASISEESAAGIEQTAASSQQTSSIMEEVSGSSEQLALLAEKLNELIRQFKL
ncbi:methyl-accepting chemotaxis protein [Ornithinibacillus scapharcae]|uniref:methyl-accepting chemotaxis protein n=1 Tax=Ornithinibacillus scapharcae TaxID=1147159 RepID=UPI000225B133|nr:methyl-accepting chemotaxis protein [Ornithinibacillus scapharcae]